MKKILIALICFFVAVVTFAFAQTQSSAPKVILMISEQNIEGPRTAWWASEIDLSATEAAIAERLLAEGFEIIDPSAAAGFIRQDRAFRVMDLSEQQSVKLAASSQANYLVVGKAIASAGGRVPQSNMRSCFANISAKVIRVKDKKVVAFVQASGNSAHLDVITGGREALVNAASEASGKIIDGIKKSGLPTTGSSQRVSR
jgi:hypothetical protein